MRHLARLILLLAGLAVGASSEAADAPAHAAVTVFAAASLAESITELAADYEKSTGVAVQPVFASSGTLAHQIEAGARVDLFISADVAWMDHLDERHLLVPGSRIALLANELVLIAPVSSATSVKLGVNAPLLAALGDGRLAIADPDSVPAGRYARAAFTAFGLWSALEPRLVRAEDVRAALAWVARGEAPLGVVYATDARVEPRVRVLDTFPASSHPPIVYPMALIAGAAPAASGFAGFLASAAARVVFEKHGFRAP